MVKVEKEGEWGQEQVQYQLGEGLVGLGGEGDEVRGVRRLEI